MILSNIAAGCISGGVTKIVDARPTNCVTYCSYTQGFYSKENGLQKLQSGLLSTPIIIGRTSNWTDIGKFNRLNANWLLNG